MTVSAPRHPADRTDEALMGECRLTRTRASGPGGQRRNKVETAVVLHHEPTGLVARASERRDAEANRRSALRRLRLLLACTRRCAWESPSERWSLRARTGRMTVSAHHADLAPLLAEALDALAAHDWEGGATATALGVSSSQLVRLLALHHPALATWNAVRAERGLRPLRP